eukprot:TRINITY_DN2167_c0_g1_i7.p2 TRINITY_DN2167_c0_g1~~TRINITY_DN2167_c0_g1_i7.p2  ORF type:complete len:226 (-),score=12.76 TRINITY_DN2167_c0_g1_i7:68-745(-)
MDGIQNHICLLFLVWCQCSGQRELAPVVLSVSKNKRRKYQHTLEQIEIEDGTNVGVHSALANTLASKILEGGMIDQIGLPKEIKREVKIGKSRLDFMVQDEHQQEWYIEVKSVTLAQENLKGGKVALFPDTVSERAQKHMHTLIDLTKQGYKGMCLYIVQRCDCSFFAPCKEKDPVYADIVKQAQAAGVELVAVSVKFNSQLNQIQFNEIISVALQYELQSQEQN